ncbi:MAG: carboxypeptidase regulatory-like domain-containing protein [Sphingobacteriaceae bacterium]|nr:MAG: carboxypeptidase regulatory-like domain-containing protein [Sphingobacteriaceae bacterium]
MLIAGLNPKPVQQPKQGISGTILLKQGNQMPGPGRTLSAGQPVARQVWVYQLTNVSQAQSSGTVFTGIKTALVAKARSNAKGNFKLSLPVGKYSVFVLEKEGLYANYFDGKGSINPVEVVKDSVTHKTIYLTNKAFF